MAQEYIIPGEVVGYYRREITHYEFYEPTDLGVDGTALLTKFEIDQYNHLLEQLNSWNAEIAHRGTYHRQSASVDGTNVHALCPEMENNVEQMTCEDERCITCKS